MHQLELYGTSGCHLCEMASAMVVAVLAAEEVSVSDVDIADDDRLVDLYGLRIPVLRDLSSGLELGWPFDALQLSDFVRGLPVVTG